jgi:hypothetical protein
MKTISKMLVVVNLYSFRRNISNESFKINFQGVDSLPFPQSLPTIPRLFVGIFILTIVLTGVVLRKYIFSFLLKSDTKNSPINFLFWVDQLNGLSFCFTVGILDIAVILPWPLKDLMGSEFCDWLPATGCFYLIGQSLWGCLIAIFRILYIKAHNCVKYKIGEKRLLWIFLFTGITVHSTVGFFLFYFDDESLQGKTCNQYSGKELEIVLLYKVIVTK